MLKEFLVELLARTAPQQFALLDGTEIFDIPMHLAPDVRKPHLAETRKVSSLQALAEYLKANRDGLSLGEMLLHVVSPARVDLLGPIDFYHRIRETILSASYPEDGSAALVNWASLDEGRIVLMSRFEDNGNTDSRKSLLLALRNVVRENLEIREDTDGVSQTVTVKDGVALKGLAKIENPVRLAPFCTFPEVPQVIRPFIFRMDANARFTLQPADGRAWEIEAVSRIKKHLESLLGDREVDVPVIG